MFFVSQCNYTNFLWYNRREHLNDQAQQDLDTDIDGDIHADIHGDTVEKSRSLKEKDTATEQLPDDGDTVEKSTAILKREDGTPPKAMELINNQLVVVEYCNSEFFLAKVINGKLNYCTSPFLTLQNVNSIVDVQSISKRSRTIRKGDIWDFDPRYVVFAFTEADYQWEGSTATFTKDGYSQIISKALNAYLAKKLAFN